jgi:3-hydroxyacyl-[acyl-carrier-protein] dehydratase
MSDVLNISEIKSYLPHRYPFLMVDRVLKYEEGKSIEAIKNVTANEEFFLGHFPLFSVMPGVLILEALAQTAGLLYFLTTKTKADDNTLFLFAGIDEARFKQAVVPGDQLHLHAEMVKNKLDIWVFNVKAMIDGKIACSATIKVAKVAKGAM